MSQTGKHAGARARSKSTAQPRSKNAAPAKNRRTAPARRKSTVPARSGSKRKKGDRPTSAQLEAELKYEQYKHRYSGVLRSTIYILIVVAALAVLVATLYMPVLRVYGTSMTPTLSEGDIVVCIKTSDYEAGDLIAFYYQSSVLIKRVIASDGDWVDIDEETGDVYVNGVLLEEPYLTEGAKAYGTVTQTLPLQISENQIFVMGDHRETSIDSRTVEVGTVAEEYRLGKIVFRLWPLSRFGFVT